MQTSGPQPAGFREKVKGWFKVGRMFFWGLAFASGFGEMLLGKRAPRSLWSGVLLLFLAAVALVDWNGKTGEKQDTSGCLPWLAFCLCWAPLYYFRQQHWAPLAAGMATAGYLVALGRSRRRSWPIAVAGCLLVGVAARRVPWPNEERLLLVFVCFGLSVALQGVWEIVRHLQGQRPEPGPAPQPKASGERVFLQFVHLIFGRLEFVQVASPSVDLRLRTRYQAATAELTSLDFDHLCSYGETFSAFRLLLVLPAIVVLSMWRNREVVRLYEGNRIQACYPLLIAKDKSTYADVNGDGVKFYTAFTDGSFLVSATYVACTLENPKITRHCRVAGIREIWNEHRSTIEAFEASGRRVNRRIDFQTFVDMSHRETAAS
jgi:hypothetical protein